jgi:hypothetical protein
MEAIENEDEIILKAKLICRGNGIYIRISKKKKTVFLKDFESFDCPDDVRCRLKMLALDYEYKVWTQLRLFK